MTAVKEPSGILIVRRNWRKVNEICNINIYLFIFAIISGRKLLLAFKVSLYTTKEETSRKINDANRAVIRVE